MVFADVSPFTCDTKQIDEWPASAPTSCRAAQLPRPGSYPMQAYSHSWLCLYAGCHSAKVPVATKMVIVRIGVPQIALLTVPAAAKGKDEDPTLLPQQSRSSDTAAAVQDRMDRTAEAETSGSDLNRTLDEEQLVSQLQTYFQESIRCAVSVHVAS